MGAKYRDRVREYSAVRGAKRAVLNALADFADGDGQAWPSEAKLAQACGMSRRSLRRHLRELQDIQVIVRVEHAGRGKPNRWGILYDENGHLIAPSDYTQRWPIVAAFSDEKAATIGTKGGHFWSQRRPLLVSETLYREPQEPQEPEDHHAHAREAFTPTLEDPPKSQPKPTPKRRRSKVCKNIDPRKIGDDNLIPVGIGETPLEVWREFYAMTPTAAQIRTMMGFENLTGWRSHVEECAVRRGFKSCGPVIDTFLNGFRNQTGGQRNGSAGRWFDAESRRSDSTNGRPPECPEDVWGQLNEGQRQSMLRTEPEDRPAYVETARQFLARQ